jgi:hypothetical protein
MNTMKRVNSMHRRFLTISFIPVLTFFGSTRPFPE